MREKTPIEKWELEFNLECELYPLRFGKKNE